MIRTNSFEDERGRCSGFVGCGPCKMAGSFLTRPSTMTSITNALFAANRISKQTEPLLSPVGVAFLPPNCPSSLENRYAFAFV
jgi:hypothetical protein